MLDEPGTDVRSPQCGDKSICKLDDWHGLPLRRIPRTQAPQRKRGCDYDGSRVTHVRDQASRSLAP